MAFSARPSDTVAVTVPARPALALPPRPALRRGLWAVPMLLSLLFVAAVLGWLVRTEEAGREEQRQELISDALSLENQVSSRIDEEARLLREAAERIDAGRVALSVASREVAAVPEVQAGLHRFWLSLTWLDASNRIVSHLPEQAPAATAAKPGASVHPGTAASRDNPAQPRGPTTSMRAASRPREIAASGLSAHLSAPLAGGGALVARYSPSNMLRQNVPWWLARKYDVRLVDSFGDVMASTTEGREPPGRQSYRIAMGPVLADSYLELIARDRITPWYRSLPGVIVVGFLLLIGATTAMLRRQVGDVSRAEEAWRTEAAWRSAMEDSLTVGLRARDFDGRLLYVNRTLCDLIGYAAEELVGLMPPMPYWPPDSLGEIMVRHARNLAGQAPRGGYEARWQHRDGRPLDVMVFEAPLVDARGRHIGWMGSILDITERKRLEEGERRRVEEATHHARLTMLGEVASTLAHELNQPLTAISSYTAGVLNSLQRSASAGHAPTDPVVLRALLRLGEQAAHAGRIVQRIREFLTRREPQLESTSLNEIVASGVALLERELARKQITLALTLDARLPAVVADAVLIEQVVINLVRNASDALAEPAPDEAAAAPRQIEVRTGWAADGRRQRVEVCDTGPGLQGRRIESLCAPFYSTKTDGMGMGLAICRSILEAHQGALEAGDREGAGACFTLTLPADPAACRRSAEARDEAQAA